MSLVTPKLDKLYLNCHFNEKVTRLYVQEEIIERTLEKYVWGVWRTSPPWIFLSVNENNANSDIIKNQINNILLKIIVFF